MLILPKLLAIKVSLKVADFIIKVLGIGFALSFRRAPSFFFRAQSVIPSIRLRTLILKYVPIIHILSNWAIWSSFRIYSASLWAKRRILFLTVSHRSRFLCPLTEIPRGFFHSKGPSVSKEPFLCLLRFKPEQVCVLVLLRFLRPLVICCGAHWQPSQIRSSHYYVVPWGPFRAFLCRSLINSRFPSRAVLEPRALAFRFRAIIALCVDCFFPC
jgi:hypothetical protein